MGILKEIQVVGGVLKMAGISRMLPVYDYKVCQDDIISKIRSTNHSAERLSYSLFTVS